MANWLSPETAPAWVQAIGSVLAILVAVAVPAWQRRRMLVDTKTERARAEKEVLRRLTTALRAEINAAVEAAARQRVTAERTLEGLAQARASGMTIRDRGPFPVGTVALTDAIVYREVAAEMGRLPPEMIRRVVQFYTVTLDLGRLVSVGSTGEGASEVLRDLTPRVQMNGAILMAVLDKFEKSDFDMDAELKLTPEEMKRFAKEVGYPLDAIAKERGFDIG